MTITQRDWVIKYQTQAGLEQTYRQWVQIFRPDWEKEWEDEEDEDGLMTWDRFIEERIKSRWEMLDNEANSILETEKIGRENALTRAWDLFQNEIMH